jgi:hypothetical protein
MKHDGLCEALPTWVGSPQDDCHCARRAYKADPLLGVDYMDESYPASPVDAAFASWRRARYGGPV